jgi:predicted dithiol-disulfide oxidoreductase (DUF899 family)
LLVREKELIRLKDSVSAARRRLPIVEITEDYTFDTEAGPASLVSRAPLRKLLAFRQRMGWKLPWVSSEKSTFNGDFGATVDGEEIHSVSVFLRDGGRVFHTWQTFNRGEEPFM